MPNLTELTEAYLGSLREPERRQATLKSYRRSLARFVIWLKQATSLSEPNLEQLTTERVRAFTRWLARTNQQNGKALSGAAQNYHLSALRSFLKYLRAQGEQVLEPGMVHLKHLTRETVTVLSAQEVERLVQAPLQSSEPQLVQLRDRALLSLLLTTGLKTAEAAALTRDQLSTAGELRLGARGLRPELVTLPKECLADLQQYLSARDDSSPALFVRHDRARGSANQPLTPRSVQRILEHYRKAANITSRLTPGTLRHTFAARLLKQGVPAATISQTLGHQSQSTLKLYRYLRPEASAGVDQEAKTT